MTGERTLYAPIIHGAAQEGWQLIRIPDGSIGKNAFDIVGACDQGFAVGMEVKVVEEPIAPGQRLPKKLFREHQITYLNLFAELRFAWSLPAIYAAKTHALYIYELPDPFSWSRPSGELLIGTLTRTGGNFTGWADLARTKVDANRAL